MVGRHVPYWPPLLAAPIGRPYWPPLLAAPWLAVVRKGETDWISRALTWPSLSRAR